MLEHQQLRLDVRAAGPGGAFEPCVADLYAAVLRPQGQEAGAAEDAAARAVERCERDLRAGLGVAQGVPEPPVEACAGAGVDLHPAPDDRVGRRGAHGGLVLHADRLEHDQPALEPLAKRRPHQGRSSLR